MVDQVYRWKRFWCPRSGHISLRDRGYLSDPESEWGHHFNPDLVSFETIAELPCLALLGEPGIGKTHAIQVELNTLTEKIQKKGHQILELDLRSYSSEDRLIRKLFESQTFTDWANGTHHLHIFLDSLDECLLRIDTLTTLLIDEFKEYRDKLTRLYLRIACRTAIFPSVLEKGLEQLWGQNSVGVYELAPLRRVDVIETANAQGLDSDAFLEEVNRKSVVAFAIKPITLRFLLNTYRRNDRKFPPNQRLSELYLEGCRSLCEEPNSNRRSSKLISSEAEQRLIVASRIAAVTVFANRYAIWTELDQGDVPDEDVLLRGLCWGHESANGREFQVSEAIVKETLDTGLFSSRGSNRMGWVHQTYAEFLAAWYLKEHSLKLSQMMNLIVHPNDPDRRIVPQLHETTAWLAGMVPRVFKEVMKTDPDVLLQSDIATVSEVDKAALVESLLKLHNQEKLAYQPSFGLYENLNHSELPEQLHPYISDSTKSISSRYVAIDIAETCNVQAVQASLADVALDPEQPYWVRMHAAKVVCYIGSEKTKARLKPLAIGETGDDPEDELKGYGLRATYPSHMTAEEVFDTLIQPRKKAFGGSYQDFLANDLGCHLKLADLRVALGWLEKRPTRRELNYPFDHLSNAIMLKAWEYLEEPGILDAFAKIASSRLRKHDKIVDDRRNSLFKQELESNDSKRRQLIEAIITSLPASEQNPMWLGGYSVHGTKIILEQDFLWMIERLQESNSEQVQKVYTKLIYRKLDWNNPDRVSAVITASQSNLVLREEFLSELEPIELGSSKAENARSRYLEIEEMRNSDEDENQSLLEPPPKERVLIALNHFESGQIDSWWYLCREMMLLPTSTHYDESFESDITVFPGWEDAEAETRTRIIAAAKVYIYQGEPETDSWLGTNFFNYSALSGYKALRLILVKDPDFISTISADIWKRWASIILAYPNAGEEKVKENRQQLIRKAYQNAPDEFIRTLLVLIDTENQQFSSIHINSQVRHCWDERLATALFDKAKDKALTASSLGSLLEDLLAHQVYQARVFAESLIPLPPPSVDEEKAKAVVAAQMLILYAEDAGWSVVWSAVQQYPEFGREVVESLSLVAAYQGGIEQKLKEDYVADLYIFLAKQYPDVEEKQESSQNEELRGVKAYTVEARDGARTWRDYVPQYLQERGTSQACEALRKIIRELPELKDKLQWRLPEAETLTRRQTWMPYQLEEVLAMICNQSLRAMRTILVLASDPFDKARLRLDREVREIDEGLRRSKYREKFNLEQKWAIRTDDFRRALLDFEPQIVHFCGHGEGNDGLVVEEVTGQPKLVSTEALAGLFALASDHVECVLLNACYSEVQADAIVQHIDYVIGMSKAIGDAAAIKFSIGFYDALGSGQTIETAYKYGCNAIQLESIPEYLTPKLKKKS